MSEVNAKTHNFTGAFELFGKSYELVKKNWKLFALLYAIPAVSMLVQILPNEENSPQAMGSLPTTFAPGGGFAGLLGGAIIIFIIFLVLSIIIELTLLGLELKAAQGKQPTFNELWNYVKDKLVSLFGLSLLTGLIIVVGLIFFVVPGLIFLRWYLLAPYYLLDQNLGITQAMSKSKEDSKKHAVAIWGVLGVLLAFTILGFFGGVATAVSFVLIMLYSVAPAIRYLEIKKAS